MDLRAGFAVLLVFAGNWITDAKYSVGLERPEVEVAVGKVDICTMCEQYVAMALDYLKDEKTQNEVVEALHNTCSQMSNLADQCTVMVDEYAKTFFSEVSSMQPEGFCKKAGLCRNPVMTSLPAKRNKCDTCHQAMDQVLDMLKDPDTELGIIERLLKACNVVDDNYKSKCKRMVFEFGPVLLVDAGTFVEKLDVCTTFHACTNNQPKIEGSLSEGGMIEMVTSS